MYIILSRCLVIKRDRGNRIEIRLYSLEIEYRKISFSAVEETFEKGQ